MEILKYLYPYSELFIQLALFLAAFLVAKFVIKKSIFSYFSNKNEQFQIRNVIIKTINTILVVLLVISSLDTIGVDVTSIIAGLGLGGFAVGFALKDSISNLLAGFLVLIYQPFKIGDLISVGKANGIVISIDLRYTKIESDEDFILIPNKKIFSESISIAKNNC